MPISSSTPISGLPQELIYKILEAVILTETDAKCFAYFLNCLLTCKLWCRLCAGEASFSHSIQLEANLQPIVSKLARRASKIGQEQINKVESRLALAFTLTNPMDVVSHRQGQITQLNSPIQSKSQQYLVQEIDCSKTDFSIQELMDLVSQHSHLRTLKINVRRLWCSHELTQETFQELLKKCPHLTSLTVKHSSLPTDAFKELSQFCPQLKFIDLRHSKIIDGRIFLHLAELSFLSKINLAYCSNVNEAFIKTITQRDLKWEELNFSCCLSEFSSESLEHLSTLGCELTVINHNEEENW